MSDTLGVFAALDSPIPWRSFGASTLDRAQDNEDLLFLVVGASWCTYSQRLLRRLAHDVETQVALRESYVPILVDGDDHPAIYARYSGGGWPSIAICTPDGWPIWRSTQVNSEDLPRLLRSLAGQDVGPVPVSLPLQLDKPAPATVADGILQAARDAYDPVSRGFALEGGAGGPRFAHFEAIELLLDGGVVADRTIALDALRQIMDRLWDCVGGGLRRYASGPDWSDVHGEKLLVDQATLVATLARAGAMGSEFRDLAAHALEWAVVHFRLDNGAFAASLRPLQGEVPAAWPVPRLDRSISIDWNARLVSAQQQLAEITGDRVLREKASALARMLLTHVQDGRVPHRVRNGVSYGATLGDQIYLAVAAFDVGLSGVARVIVDRALSDHRLADGSLADIRLDGDDPGLLRSPIAPLRENAAFAELCARFGGAYVNTARQILAATSEAANRAGIMASCYGLAQSRVDAVRSR